MGCNSEKVIIERIEAFAGSTVVLLAMIKNIANAAIVQSGVSSVRVDVYDLSEDPKLAVDSSGVAKTDGSAYASPSVSSVVFNTAQTDNRWTKDSAGYNFAYNLIVPSVSDKNYEVRITITDSASNHLIGVWEIISK